MGCGASEPERKKEAPARPTAAPKAKEASQPKPEVEAATKSVAPAYTAPVSAPVKAVETQRVEEPSPAKRLESTGKFGRELLIADNPKMLTEVYDVEERKIGQGGYGSVSKAVHKSTKQLRAVKTMPRSRPKDIQTFKTECRSTLVVA